MELKTVQEKQKATIDLVLKGNIAKAFKTLSELAIALHQGDYMSEVEKLEVTYKNILKYSFGYPEDPKRVEIYTGLKRKLIELTDDIASVMFELQNQWFSSIRKKDKKYFQLGEHEKSEMIESMEIEKEFSAILSEVELKNEHGEKGKSDYDQSLMKVFEILWLSNNYREGEKILVDKLFKTEHIPWHDKSLIVSAISLSLLRHFDSTKTDLLFNIYEMGQVQVAHRALVGIFIAFIVYKDRFVMYPEIEKRIKSITNNKKFSKQIEQIVIQFIKAQETERVTEKIQKEIIPEVMKLSPEINEKLKLDELLSADDFEEKNPDWQEFFSDSPDVYKKLEEFSMMQMDGSDVFMGAFSMLKRFGFFESFSNWFLPFYKEQNDIWKSMEGVDKSFNWKTLVEGIEQAPVMCNSDKFSFCFNIGFMPDLQKNMMLEMFNMEMKAMKEMAEEDNRHNSEMQDKTIFTQYIQDLYRFFKLHPNKNNFNDIFNIAIDLPQSDIFNSIFEKDNIRHIGEFFFQKDYYKEALEIFEFLFNDNQSFELIEKIGYCYQKLGKYNEAIDYYKKGEILETNRMWLLKKLGYCYHRINKYEDAIKYYKRVETIESDNLEIQAFLGQLHIDKEDYEAALKYYFKVEYLKPDLLKVQRPIAWCSFLLDKPEQAIRYLMKIVNTEGLRSDYLNLGHCYWCKGEVDEAVKNYQLALKSSGGDTNWFWSALKNDEKYLKQYDIKEIDIALMADFITSKS